MAAWEKMSLWMTLESRGGNNGEPMMTRITSNRISPGTLSGVLCSGVVVGRLKMNPAGKGEICPLCYGRLGV